MFLYLLEYISLWMVDIKATHNTHFKSPTRSRAGCGLNASMTTGALDHFR